MDYEGRTYTGFPSAVERHGKCKPVRTEGAERSAKTFSPINPEKASDLRSSILAHRRPLGLPKAVARQLNNNGSKTETQSGLGRQKSQPTTMLALRAEPPSLQLQQSRWHTRHLEDHRRRSP